MRIVAYCFEADIHCPDCTYRRFGRHTLPQWQQDERPDLTDSHGVVLASNDREGNPVHPVFSTDEITTTHHTHCGTCLAPLKD